MYTFSHPCHLCPYFPHEPRLHGGPRDAEVLGDIPLGSRDVGHLGVMEVAGAAPARCRVLRYLRRQAPATRGTFGGDCQQEGDGVEWLGPRSKSCSRTVSFFAGSSKVPSINTLGRNEETEHTYASRFPNNMIPASHAWRMLFIPRRWSCDVTPKPGVDQGKYGPHHIIERRISAVFSEKKRTFCHVVLCAEIQP